MDKKPAKKKVPKVEIKMPKGKKVGVPELKKAAKMIKGCCK